MAAEAGSEQLVRIARLNTILSVTFAVVFSAAAGYRMGPSVWMFHSQKEAKVQTVSTSSSRVEKDLYKEAAETVVAASIFGKLPPKAVYTPGKGGTQGGTGGRKTATGEMPRTSLHLDITGLIYSDDHKRGLVIIKTGKDEDNYREGDLIRGTRARIQKIEKNHIVVDNSGRLEKAPFDPDVKSGGSSSSAVSTGGSSSGQALGKEFSNVTLPEVMSLSPVYEKEELRGYRLNPGTKPQLFSKLGFRPNDLAVEIDGISLRDKAQAMGVLQSISTADNVTVTVERDGGVADVMVKLR